MSDEKADIAVLDLVYFRSPNGRSTLFGYVEACLDNDRYLVRCEYGPPLVEVHRSELRGLGDLA